MISNIKTYSVQVNGSSTKYLIIAPDDSRQAQFIEMVKKMPKCKVVEYPRSDADIASINKIQEVCIEVLKGDNR